MRYLDFLGVALGDWSIIYNLTAFLRYLTDVFYNRYFAIPYDCSLGCFLTTYYDIPIAVVLPLNLCSMTLAHPQVLQYKLTDHDELYISEPSSCLRFVSLSTSTSIMDQGQIVEWPSSRVFS